MATTSKLWKVRQQREYVLTSVMACSSIPATSSRWNLSLTGGVSHWVSSLGSLPTVGSSFGRSTLRSTVCSLGTGRKEGCTPKYVKARGPSRKNRDLVL